MSNSQRKPSFCSKFWSNRYYTFVIDAFAISPTSFYLLRFIFLGIHLVVLFWSIAYVADTSLIEDIGMWGFWISLLFYFTVLLEQTRKIVGHAPTLKSKNCLAMFSHLMYEVAFSMQLVIVLWFWGVYYGTEFSRTKYTGSQLVFNIIIHGGLFLILWIDNLFNLVRFHTNHLWLVLGVLTLYLFQNLVVTLTVSPFYLALSWNDFKSFLIILCFYLLCYIHFMIGQWYFSLKMKWRTSARTKLRLLSEVNEDTSQKIIETDSKLNRL